jgi:hypothetical protein
LHKNYAKAGLVAISVSLDDPAEKGKQEAVLKFLNSKNASFTNLILDESQEFWQKKLSFFGPPCVYVFNLEGKWKRFEGAEHYPEVEKLVARYLKVK